MPQVVRRSNHNSPPEHIFLPQRLQSFELQIRLEAAEPRSRTANLRNIRVQIQMDKPDFTVASNPFILTTLPLNNLQIDFGNVEPGGWHLELCLYHKLISALMYKKAPGAVDTHPSQVLELIWQNRRRTLAVHGFKIWATKKQLYNVLTGMKTKRVALRCVKDDKDIIYSAFAYFGLRDSACSVFRRGGVDGQKWYLAFGDKTEQNLLEMGRWPMRRRTNA